MNGQKNKILPNHCDSHIKCKDIDILTLKPISIDSKKNPIAICYKMNNIIISVKDRDAVLEYHTISNNKYYIITMSDSIHGAHKYKNLFDSILVTDRSIVIQRKYFRKDKRLLYVQIKMLVFNINTLESQYFEYWPEKDFNIVDYIPDILNHSFEKTLKNKEVKMKNFQLEKRNEVLYFNKKSLFSQIRGNFLDFSIR